MKYKLAIFDFDGTLADSFPLFLGSVNDLAEQHQFRKIDFAQLETLRGYDAGQMISHVGLPMWKVPIVAASFKKLMAQRIGQVPLFPGVQQMLAKLRAAGIGVSVITSNAFENVSRLLGPATMSTMIAPQCGTSLFGKRAKLKTVLRAANVSVGEALYIGDELRDLQAARAEGVRFGAVGWGYTRADALLQHSPEEFFANVEEIATKLMA